jgi:hypothetical protein
MNRMVGWPTHALLGEQKKQGRKQSTGGEFFLAACCNDEVFATRKRE